MPSKRLFYGLTPPMTPPMTPPTPMQDVVIALGRRSMKSLRYSNPVLNFEVQNEKAEFGAMERLNIEARSWSGRLVKLVIWADGVAWVFSRPGAEDVSIAQNLDRHANLAGLSAEDIADVVRCTLKDPWSTEEFWRARAIGGPADKTKQKGIRKRITP
jgi:hypothetical protein